MWRAVPGATGTCGSPPSPSPTTTPSSTYQEETLPWQGGVPAGHAELIEGLLLRLAAECRSRYLDYQAELRSGRQELVESPGGHP